MKNFNYTRANTIQDVVDRPEPAMLIAGGTNLVDRMKVFLDEPTQVIDISRLDLKKIETTGDGLRLGALVTNTQVADFPVVRQNYPILSRAILAGASQQIRNVASVGGNLMQRTRCPYYYDTAFSCNKRQPGSGCPAATGINRMHAIFGASDKCVAVNPSDMCVALAALDAVVEVEGVSGRRQIPFSEFHRLPGNQPERDTALEEGEIITAVILPANINAKSGVYLKLRDRASYSFALISVAAILDIDNNKICNARIALGGVAHKPWRTQEAEQFLVGKAVDTTLFQQAADLALRNAQPLEHNKFKVEMSKRAIRRALMVSANGGGIA
ncbi:FAD-binding molybdopterin dehydrogenase [Dulcicalothrix desertica PCC 7102]|uniref:FAD-binding molybdopterin dehydrogenase n=1 Tax=Dulcicalothrix desertica PCC 7102 TaxID=232991 RepID=A0A433VB05_9CYAN|nr:xanthine dehydrogenase family protein subunit M [Dulcicalothrix desertica]RUT03199.1 FAD-binding molybdopterin dehydrogenase [Dulcicalothrix desertica PCC 7102]TWH53569.1 xanthine dehydrogenase YagS FAD-binding subunit [Dulcicalothrix desertica PCC 7102]